jgi:hypothetical protein
MSDTTTILPISSETIVDLTSENTLTTDSNAVATTTEIAVADLYSNYLYREADEEGLNYWTEQIDAGAMTLAEATQSFVESEEFSGSVEPIARLYYSLLNRIPDQAGLEYWISEHRHGKELEEIADSFLQAEETQAIYSTSLDDTSFVTSLYSNFLGREIVGSDEVDYWTSQLQSGMSRAELVYQFSESEENILQTSSDVETTLLYHGVLGRQPTEDELSITERAVSAADLIEELFAEAGLDDINVTVNIPAGLDGKSPHGLDDHLPSGWFKLDSSDDNDDTEEDTDLVDESDDTVEDSTVLSDTTTDTDVVGIGVTATTDYLLIA